MRTGALTHSFSISEELQSSDWKDLSAKGKIADAVIIAVMVTISSLLILVLG